MTAALWILGVCVVVGILAYVLHRYVRHREFISQEQGIVVGKAIGRLTDEELFAIIHGFPMPVPAPQKRRRRWRR